MKARLIFSGVVGLALILGSCGSSNSVVSNGLIQKRKYNKGFFMKSNGQFKSAKADVKEENTYVVSEELAVQAPMNKTKVPAVVTKSVKSEKTVENAVVQVAKTSAAAPATTTSKASVPAHLDAVQNVETKKQVRKTVRQEAKKNSKKDSGSNGADGYTILLVILAIIIPPLAVGLFEGITVRFWIDLILALLGWGLLGWLLPGLIWLGGLAAIIYALLIVLSVI